MVWQRQERVTPPPLHRVPSPATPDPEALEAGGKGLRVETPQGSGGKEAVEGGGYGGCAEVSGEHPGRTLIVGRVARAPREVVGKGAVSEGEEGGLGPP